MSKSYPYPAVLGRKEQPEKERLSNMFTVLGRFTKGVAVGTGLAALFGIAAAPTAATVVTVAGMWLVGYAEHTLGNLILQEDKAARDIMLGKPAQKLSVFKAMKSALTII